MPNKTQNPNQNSEQNQNQEQSPKKELLIIKTLLVVLIFIALGTIIIGGAYIIGEYSKTSNNQSINNNKIWNPIHKCSEEHPEVCDRSCEIDSDCYPSCTYSIGCLRSGEGQVGASAIKCEVAPFSCKCEDNKCEIVEYDEIEKDVSITTDKIEYQTDEEVKLTIKNNLEDSIFFGKSCYTNFEPFPVLQRYEKNKWINYEWNPYPPVFNKCIIDVFVCLEIENITRKITLLLKTNDSGAPLFTGKHRIALTFGKSCDGQKNHSDNNFGLLDEFIVYSNEFEINKKVTDTSNWQTYRNEEYGFEVDYPEEWRHESYVMSEIFFQKFNKDSNEFICKFDIAMVVSEYFDKYIRDYYPNFYRGDEFKTGNNFVIKRDNSYFIKRGDEKKYSIHILTNIEKSILSKDEFKKIISVPFDDPECVKYFEKILSSFKFIEK